MEVFTWPGPEVADEAGVAVLIPGAGYRVESPLLFWPAQQLVQRNWRVLGIRWTADDEPGEDPHGFVASAVEHAFAQYPSVLNRLIVAKSYGTFAIPWAEQAHVPAVWLTPLLKDKKIRSAAGRSALTDLFVGGSADQNWLVDELQESTGTFITVPGADHGLQIIDDWRASVDIQSQVFEHIDSFFAAIGVW